MIIISGWSMMEGIYFTFVTLSTIGFGDYVVNGGAYVHDNTTGTVVTQFNLLFLILGLGVVSSVLCSISQLLESGGLGCCKRRGEESDPNEVTDGDAGIET
jgi:O-antigen/teichoic acid export membrane protein